MYVYVDAGLISYTIVQCSRKYRCFRHRVPPNNIQRPAINDVTAGSRRWLSYLLYRIRTGSRYSARSVGRINFRTAIAYV